MPEIQLLTQETIDKIAAGEVVERPSSVVKELVENAVDAGAKNITVEIRDGGCSLIRITDNGCGIDKRQIRLAFLRHSTSKIRSIEDLLSVSSLGFRGEALSSISAVARVELITKTRSALTGSRYIIEGSKELSLEEIGAPEGTTFLVRDLFYNTPARKKFLKSPHTEGSYVTELAERLALSHPEVSLCFINNQQTRLHTSGNGNEKDIIYHIFGREITSMLLPLSYQGKYFSVHGYIGKPAVVRGNRNFENYFVNGRFVKSKLLAKAIEDSYKGFIMQHQFPFTILYFDFPGDGLDVNVHPSKMELRFDHNAEIYEELCNAIRGCLTHRDLIPEVSPAHKPPVSAQESRPYAPDPKVLDSIRRAVAKDSPYEKKYPAAPVKEDRTPSESPAPESAHKDAVMTSVKEETVLYGKPVQTRLSDLSPDFMSQQAKAEHRIIGQLFETYWLVEYQDRLYMIDQHAAHEKVLYEKMMKALSEKTFSTQAISPPLILTLDSGQEDALRLCLPQLEQLGYEIESFGGRDYMITGIPAEFSSLDMKDLFLEMLDEFSESGSRVKEPRMILEKVASMSCKAAVKGNNRLSRKEIGELIDSLLELENPYNCPHGRPTMISMSKYELDKKFKRILS